MIFDCVGVPGSLQLVIDYAGFDARVIVVGLCMTTDVIAPAKAITKELDVSFTFVYSHAEFGAVVDLLARERIDPSALVTGATGFSGFPEAFEAMKRPGDAIKLMLEPD